MKKTLLSIVAFFSMLACNSQKQDKTLILYYSQSETTAAIAAELQKQTGWDIERIDVTPAYTGSFNDLVQLTSRQRQSGELPKLNPVKSDLSKYSTIFLGYPIWSGTYCIPMELFVKQAKLDGKKIVTFCSFGSGGLNTSTDNLKKALPAATVIEGYGVRQARTAAIPAEVERFLIAGGWKEGKVETLPDFSAMVPVTESDVKLFNEACSSYQFPLGTPVEVASRKAGNATEYKFSVTSRGFGGGGSTKSIIYVIAQPGKPAEFTQVVR